MINLNVVCNPVLKFENGVVTGEIHVNPDSILASIMSNLDLPYNGDLRIAVKNLIVETSLQHMKDLEPNYITLVDGVVTNYDLVSITMHEAMDLLDSYVSELIPDESLRRRRKNLESYETFKEIVYKCDDCNCLGDTANICILYSKK